MTLNIDSFMTVPGYQAETNEQPSAMMQGAPDEARPTAPAYKIQPVAWMFIAFALAIVGLYYFLEE